MALGLPTGGGFSRVPILKYDARAGRLFRVDREANAAGQFESNAVEITSAFQAVIDVENIERGWLSFPTNAAPDIVTAPFNAPMPDKPSPNHRPGFRVYMLLGKACGGDVREMAANAQVSINGMDNLHNAYLAGVKANPGMLPVVKLAGTKPVTSSGKGQSSTNYEPVWEIAAWVNRPGPLAPDAIAKLKAGGSAEASGAPAAPPPPPPPPPPPASFEDDF